MGNIATGVKLGAAVVCYLMDYSRAQEQVAGCVEGEGGCKRCRGDMCTRCAVLLHQGVCVDSCPPGHTADWSTKDEYMGRVCKETGYMFGLTGSQVAILLGVVSGATICIFIIICGALIVRRKKQRAAKLAKQYEDSAERKEFLRHLSTLRGEANTFLAMLNDTRRQVRELYYSGNNGDGAVGIQAYRPVLRDLARILVMVNRREEDLPVPPDDWQRLFSWAERLLRRYKRHSSPEVAQLVTFLQQPSTLTLNQQQLHQQQQQQVQQQTTMTIGQQVQGFESRATPTNLTTFQANVPLSTFQASDKSSVSAGSSSLEYAKDGGSPLGSSLGQNSSGIYNDKLGSPNGSTVGQMTPLVYQKRAAQSSPRFQELSINAFDRYDRRERNTPADCGIARLDRELNPQWEFQGTIEAANYTILSDWSHGRDYLIDDFTILGFRPQDEITTEL